MWQQTRAQERAVVVVGVLVALAFGSLLLGASGSDPTITQRMDELEAKLAEKADRADLDQLDERLHQLDQQKADRTELASLVESVEYNATTIENNTQQIVVNASSIADQRGDINALRDIVDIQRGTLEQISQSDGSRHFPRIETNMQIDSFREEMRRVVNQSIHPVSHIKIRNETNRVQQITVNENGRFTLNAHQETDWITVPTGNVTTRLIGQDLVNWAVGAPSYRQSMRIVNRPGTRVTYWCY